MIKSVDHQSTPLAASYMLPTVSSLLHADEINIPNSQINADLINYPVTVENREVLLSHMDQPYVANQISSYIPR